MLNALWMHDACHRRPLCAGMRACCSHFWITCCVKTLGPQDCKILGVQSLPCFGFSDFLPYATNGWSTFFVLGDLPFFRASSN